MTREKTGKLMTDNLTITQSELAAFRRCKRKWYLAWYRNLGTRPEDEAPTGSRQLGIRIHAALERLYGHGEDPVIALDAGYDALECEYGHDLDAASEINKERDLAHAMVSGYLGWAQEQGIDEGLTITDAEAELRVPSGVDGVDLRGKLDVRAERVIDGARLFRDFKSVGDLTGPVKILPLNEQFRFYHLLEKLNALDKTGEGPQVHTDGGLVVLLRRVKRTAQAKPPFYRQVEVHHNVHDVRSMWLRVQRMIREILQVRRELDDGADHRYAAYPTPAGDCSWSCPFVGVCVMADDGSRFEDALAANYVQIDHDARYNNSRNESTNGGGSSS